MIFCAMRTILDDRLEFQVESAPLGAFEIVERDLLYPTFCPLITVLHERSLPEEYIFMLMDS